MTAGLGSERSGDGSAAEPGGAAASGPQEESVVGQGDEAPPSDQLSLDLGVPEVRPAKAAGDGLDPNLTFEAFVPDRSNRLPYDAAVFAAQNTGTRHNPLFLHGEPGTGKTHLLHAIGLALRARTPQAGVRYVTAERFRAELAGAVQDDALEAFKRRYRSCSLVLVDDVQFLGDEEATQTELFHTFNDVLAAGGRVVLAADRHPGRIDTLPDLLRSRFSSGLVTDLKAPEMETRMEILRKKAASEGAEVPDEVLARIASTVTRNVRELEGALNRVLADAGLEPGPLTPEAADRSLRRSLGSSRRWLRSRQIIEEAADEFDVSVEVLSGYSRTRPLVATRQATMHVCRTLTEESLPAIGRAFGGRDHTTVLYNVRKADKLLANPPNPVSDQVAQLLDRLQARPVRGPDGRLI